MHACFQFECVEEELDGVPMEKANDNDHVKAMERLIRTMKEGSCCQV